LSTLDNSFWSFGPAVTMPIFHAGSLEANVAAQRALAAQALDAYRKTVLVALQDVESALVAYAKEQERRTALAEAARVQAQAVDLATQLYSAGRTDFLNVLSAQQLQFAADNALVLSNQAVVTDLVALYNALGGGWEASDDVVQPSATAGATSSSSATSSDPASTAPVRPE
jgi:outer membrane protein TolC